ncbi:PREDICTED: BRCA1-associated RING domain protein 1-like [Ceratosolen solmsi marchali]|uniref:BRCA1-associated RING domain protein 1-like n=1 Tax=Ceratosolen solmsi marchali TaxID=326594 RepID=A0AAJ6YUK1_9HYME|nr:PREDICTED: BRCA1-associated RING domain protein 1-like [Ceratosolen solmsi marchali]
MPLDTIWVKTHTILNIFFQKLTCPKCRKILNDPQQFLNCGHFACMQCIQNESECIQCKIPGKASDICPDQDVSDLIINLNVIAEEVGLSLQNNNTNNKNKTNEILTKNINKKNKKGETALHIASRSNNEDRVKTLLTLGANPNTKDFAGWTPLQEAASFGLYNICEALLKGGALPDMHGYDNRTALHEAVLNDDYDIALLLMNSNANKKVFDNVGKHPENYCKSQNIAELFKHSQDLTDKSEIFCELNKTLEHKLLNQISTETKIVLYGSDLSHDNQKLLIKLGIEKKLKVVNTFSPAVSHVIIDTNAANYIKPTFDILLTMLHGKWLVSSDCLLILNDSTNITVDDLSLFEVNPLQLDDASTRARQTMEKQNPKLFNNCCFYFAIKNYDFINYEEMKITKDRFMKLVAAGDGITLKREPKPEHIQGSVSPFHVAHDSKHSLHKCTHYIIYFDSNSETNRMLYNMPFLKSLPFMWFVECILRYKLVDPVDLGLLS